MQHESGDLYAIDGDDGAILRPNESGEVTLAADTYYVPLTDGSARCESVHARFASAVAATITLELCNFPAYKGGLSSGVADVSDWDETAGNWIQENPSTAYVGVSAAGCTATAATVTKAAGNAGGFTLNLGNIGTKRARLKIVATVGGACRIRKHSRT